MGYLLVVLAVLIIAIGNITVMVFVYGRTMNRPPAARDQIIGLLIGGPLYYFVERGLRERNHHLTRFERYGLLGLILFVLFIVVGGILDGISKYPF